MFINICSWASSHAENRSCEQPAPEMETFFIRGTQQRFPPKYIKKHWASVLFSRKFSMQFKALQKLAFFWFLSPSNFWIWKC